MFLLKSRQSLTTFVTTEAMSSDLAQVGAIQLLVPLWDIDLLQKDAEKLLEDFEAGVQFGDTHNRKWLTLSLRSSNGSTDNDSPSLDLQYLNTPAWSASTYIVPMVLRSFGPTLIKYFERVRLSIVPPNCNVAWHVDYAHLEHHVTRLHIPIHCSKVLIFILIFILICF